MVCLVLWLTVPFLSEFKQHHREMETDGIPSVKHEGKKANHLRVGAVWGLLFWSFAFLRAVLVMFLLSVAMVRYRDSNFSKAVRGFFNRYRLCGYRYTDVDWS